MKLKLPTNLPEKSVLIKILLAFAGVFLTLLIIAIIFGQKKQPTTLLPTPTPTAQLIQEVTNPSVYATDETVLKIEKKLIEIESELQKVDLKETSLNPPVLDFNIKF